MRRNKRRHRETLRSESNRCRPYRRRQRPLTKQPQSALLIPPPTQNRRTRRLQSKTKAIHPPPPGNKTMKGRIVTPHTQIRYITRTTNTVARSWATLEPAISTALYNLLTTASRYMGHIAAQCEDCEQGKHLYRKAYRGIAGLEYPATCVCCGLSAHNYATTE